MRTVEPMTSSPDRPNRTSLITAAAIVGVLLAGSAAVAANIGILDAADGSPIGDLQATGDLTQFTGTAAGAVSPPTSDAAAGSPTEYTVDTAGTVVVLADSGQLALSEVRTNDGWTSDPAHDGPTALTVTFTNADRTVVFTASLAADGSIVADVTEPITVAGNAAPIASSSEHADDDSDDHDSDRDDHDDSDHDHDDSDDYHEGRDDDD